MSYAKLQNNKVVKYPVNPMIEHTNVSFPLNWGGGDIDGSTYVRVQDVPFPPTGNYQKVVEGTPINNNGVWQRNFTVVNLTPEEKANLQAEMWESIRSQRNEKLQQSDWTQLSDVSLTENQKQQWVTYRQQLRNITISFNDPALVVWPTPPQIG